VTSWSRKAERSVLAIVVCLASVACGRAGQRRYLLSGVVQEARQANGEFVVAHGDIPGFMPAMTMPFRVKRMGGPPNLQPGDGITARLVVTDTESWLEDVAVTVRGLPIAKIAAESKALGAVAGAQVPDFHLVNQDGAPIHLGQYAGRTLVLTFIYTRCPIPEFCPLMMKNFQALDKALAGDPALFARTHLLSITFDTQYDKPEVLRRFGRVFMEDRGGSRFDHWELATGSAEQVKAAAEFFGLAYWGEGTEIAHSLRTAVIGPGGRVVRLYTDNLWTVEEALAEIQRATTN
jgi:protein SCO1